MKHVERIALLLTIMVLLPIFSSAQLQSISRYRVASTTAAFGFPVPKGTEIVDNSTGGMYLLKNNASPTASISSLTEGTDYVTIITQTLPGSLISNLNAEYLNGHNSSYYQVAGNYDNYQNWILKDDAGATLNVTKSFPLSVLGGGLISTHYDPVNKSLQISTAANNYTLPAATSSTLGGVKTGSRISISNGVISADVQSDNNFTSSYKSKLDGIASQAEVNVNADWNATSGDAAILHKPTTIAGYGITDANANQAFVIKNPGGSIQWTITIGNYNALIFKNSSGNAVMYLDQSGNLKVSGDIEAYSTIPL